MKPKIIVVLSILLFLSGCSYFGKQTKKVEEYSKIEILLSDFSKKVTAYYEKQDLSIPKDFDEKQFFEVLEKVYPDQKKVKLIKDGFKVEARSIDDHYSVMLCDPDTDKKIMEDFSCDLRKVEIRCWDKDENVPCVLEENWNPYCK